jgi:ketosteroid isomerase-like protein
MFTHGDDHLNGDGVSTLRTDTGIAAELTQLMAEIDGGFFCSDDRERADAYWTRYLQPEIERLFDPRVAFQSHFEGPEGRSLFVGYEGLRQWAEDVFECYVRFRRRNEDWESLREDALLVHQRIEATGRESGAEIDLRLWVLWRIDGGRISELRTFADRYEALAAADSEPTAIR